MAYEFLFLFHRNYARILYRFRNKARYGSKAPIFIPRFHLTSTITQNATNFPLDFKQTAPVPRLLDGAKILPKSSTLCIGCNNVTDRRQTDGLCHISSSLMLITFGLWHEPSVCRLSSVCRLCVCVTLLHPRQRPELFGNIFALSHSSGTRAVCVKILGKNSKEF